MKKIFSLSALLLSIFFAVGLNAYDKYPNGKLLCEPFPKMMSNIKQLPIELMKNNDFGNRIQLSYTNNNDEILANSNLIESVQEYFESGDKYRYNYTYDSKEMILIVLIEKWGNGEWVPNLKYTYDYNIEGDLVNLLLETWDDTNWKNEIEYNWTFTYDSKGNILIEIYKTWASGLDWINDTRTTCTYDGNGFKNSIIIEQWDDYNQQWVNERHHTFTYDTKGNVLTEYEDTWDETNNKWIGHLRFTYTYDTNGDILSELWQSWDVFDKLVNDSRETYTYDQNGNMLSDFVESWKDGGWSYSSRTTAEYDTKGNLLNLIMVGWENGTLINRRKYTGSYDAKGNVVLWLREDWNGDATNGLWVDSRRYISTYDTKGNLLTQLCERWKNGKWNQSDGDFGHISFEDRKRNLFRFQGCSINIIWKSSNSISEETNNVLSLACYPNPSSGLFHITYSVLVKEEISLSIINSLGIEVANLINNKIQLTDKNNICFDARNLPSGNYYVTLKAGEQHKTVEIIVIK